LSDFHEIFSIKPKNKYSFFFIYLAELIGVYLYIFM
jgi:hypothetical protein